MKIEKMDGNNTNYEQNYTEDFWITPEFVSSISSILAIVIIQIHSEISP